jgi:hypothetical protein
MYTTGRTYNENSKLFFDSSFYSPGASLEVNFGTFGLNGNNYELPSNTAWSIDVPNTGYKGISGGLDIRYGINNSSNTVYPGYYLESYLNKPKNYRILNITEESSEVFNINALEYNEDKFKNIDNAGTQINVPIKPNPPVVPALFLSGIFRSPSTDSYCTTDPCNGSIFTTNQGGINSIMYNILPTGNYSSNNLYYVYIKSGTNFTSSTETPESFLFDIVSAQNLVTGRSTANWATRVIPPFFTPLYAGNYFLRVFAENTIGERSTYVTGSLNLASQASALTVETSGRNLY